MPLVSSRVFGCAAALRHAAASLLIAAAVAVASGADAPPAGQEVEVANVRFNAVRTATGAGPSGNWLEADVVLNVRPRPGSPGQMLSRVRVSLLLGFELPAPPGGERRIENYRAEAECVALDAGRADVRFYLPPEVVRRDQLHGDPRFWAVELALGGKPVPAGKNAYAPTLAGTDARKNFQTRASAAAAGNDGVLLPQYLTPFEIEYPRATPSFVRKSATP